MVDLQTTAQTVSYNLFCSCQHINITVTVASERPMILITADPAHNFTPVVVGYPDHHVTFSAGVERGAGSIPAIIFREVDVINLCFLENA